MICFFFCAFFSRIDITTVSLIIRITIHAYNMIQDARHTMQYTSFPFHHLMQEFQKNQL